MCNFLFKRSKNYFSKGILDKFKKKNKSTELKNNHNEFKSIHNKVKSEAKKILSSSEYSKYRKAIKVSKKAFDIDAIQNNINIIDWDLFAYSSTARSEFVTLLKIQEFNNAINSIMYKLKPIVQFDKYSIVNDADWGGGSIILTSNKYEK